MCHQWAQKNAPVRNDDFRTGTILTHDKAYERGYLRGYRYPPKTKEALPPMMVLVCFPVMGITNYLAFEVATSDVAIKRNSLLHSSQHLTGSL